MLCRIYNKKGTIERRQQQASVGSRSAAMASAVTEEEDTKPVILTPVPESSPMVYDDFMYLDASDSMPRLHTDSSCSEHVLSPEVESAPKLADWERSALEFPFGYMDGVGGGGLMGAQFQGNYQMESMQEVFAPFMSKPF